MIFRCKEDYFQFLEIVKRYLDKFQIAIFNYCLMPNHIHLLTQAIRGSDLPKFMQDILQVYAGYFRKKYNAVGFVFQNRYKSLFINKESYILECAQYIEQNPLRAKLTPDIFNYPWSSFSYYVSGIENGIIKRANPFYMKLAASGEERRKQFHNFVLEERPYDQIVDDFFKIR